MEIKVKSNLVSGIAAVVFSIALWFIIPVQIVDMSTKLIKSDFLPRLISVVIFICGIWLAVGSLLKKKEEIIVKLVLNTELRVVLYTAAIVLYILVFDRIGFLLSSLFLALFTLAFVKEKRPLFYVITAVYVASLFFIFKYALGTPLPSLLFE